MPHWLLWYISGNVLSDGENYVPDDFYLMLEIAAEKFPYEEIYYNDSWNSCFV